MGFCYPYGDGRVEGHGAGGTTEKEETTTDAPGDKRDRTIRAIKEWAEDWLRGPTLSNENLFDRGKIGATKVVLALIKEHMG